MAVPPASLSGFAPHAAVPPGPGLLRREWPLPVRVLVVLVLYGGYFLLGGGLTGERMPYDAGHYWELAVALKDPATGFSLLNFQDPTRGYCAALLQFPALIVRFITHCSMPVAAKITGVAWATLLYAWLLPALWRSMGLGRVAGGRWLLLLLLGFAFWRDHFSFSMADMPALSLLLLALWALSRVGLGWWLLAGLSLAVSCNSRPAYLAAVPAVLGLAVWWSLRHGRRHGRSRWTVLLLGMALVLAPQWQINRRYYGQNTPLVLARVNPTDTTPLYLRQLTWGTRVLRYDTSLQQRLIYADPAGLAVLRAEGIREYGSYGQFLGILLHHPFDYTVRYLRHLFNGLDVQQPAPYLIRDYGPERPWVQLLNYTALGVGLLTLLRRPTRWLTWPRALLLLALLLPCMAGIPTAIECRFLLPLHLLLLAVAAFGFSPSYWQWLLRGRPGRARAVVLVAGLWLGGCFWLSAATFRNLQPDHGKSLVDD
ncbi:hypothetical protein [Hymenobacter canadensis]|uniref:Glycosyltransferase RgtA/B/C/D-like domain-containing protein n=1 Tax=Hymenobacter canadensis TaxID=2999067 RepID=A0ABY7LRS7_9BACT|nr:hypothetical protein [Hymenobacter canadensis]WBA42656.1 hypothetical protein O3303_03635 [Hymenobacter canadensis]